jgi:hypothetical protein
MMELLGPLLRHCKKGQKMKMLPKPVNSDAFEHLSSVEQFELLGDFRHLSTSGNEERKHWFRVDGFRVMSASKCFDTNSFSFFLFFWPQYFSGSNNGQASLMKTCPYRPFGEEGFLACVFRSLPTEAVAVRILKGYDDLG